MPGHRSPVPIIVKAFGKMDMSLPTPMIRDTPFAIPIIPMVTMKAGTPVVTMIVPLTKPARAPTPTPARIARKIGIWPIRTDPTRTGGDGHDGAHGAGPARRR